MLRTILCSAAAVTTLVAAQDDLRDEAEKAAANIVSVKKASCENPTADGLDDTELCATQHAAFTDWLKEGGATLHPGVEIGYSESGRRGLFTTAPLAKGADLATIPRSLWLDEPVAMESAAGDLLKAVKEQAKGMPPHIPTLLWLIHERLMGTDSMYDPYFQMLPKYDDIAMTWRKEARGVLLEGAAPGLTNDLVHKVWHDADKEYIMLSENIMDARPEIFPQAPPGAPQNARFPQRLRAAYDFAAATIFSRPTSHESRELTAVVPFLDLPNHDNSASEGEDYHNDQRAQPPSWEVQEEVDSIKMLAGRDYEAGEELYAAYDVSSQPILRCGLILLEMVLKTDCLRVCAEQNHRDLAAHALP